MAKCDRRLSGRVLILSCYIPTVEGGFVGFCLDRLRPRCLHDVNARQRYWRAITDGRVLGN